VYFHGYVKLCQQLWHAPNWNYRLQILIQPPIWAWKRERETK
ncbi:sterol desaturase family protein, partial [Vibrio splendidus]